jgi:predicted CXXCH cytochrome family protein
VTLRPLARSFALRALVLIAAIAAASCRRQASPRPPVAAPSAYAGAAACAGCHAGETALWRTSDHALAMQKATASTVLADFAERRVKAQGVVSTFTHRGDLFGVRTEGPDGRLADFAVAYTFGVRPLQQYLVPLPGGRLQALGLAWDSRPAAAGGQRWFDLYAGDRVRAGDPLHWTSPQQNWNFMCAECHSTDLGRRYDAASGTYDTQWEEIEVACEACHGPGADHVAWASAHEHPQGSDDGLAVRFPPFDPAAWRFEGDAPTVRRAAPPPSDAALETCARCHSRRGWEWKEVRPGGPIADSHRVALLDAGLYFDDGQIKDEVYEYGSFLQSLMHERGVRCSDCHDPHSGRTRAEGNALCARCHRPDRFDTPAHHHHVSGSGGARCAACHMPERTYMTIDVRRDHSLRVPRPDLSVALGVPNACSGCHADRGAAWAAQQVAHWFPGGRSSRPHYGEALHRARQEQPGGTAGLLGLLADPGLPGIVRATALAALPQAGDPAAVRDVVMAAVRDPSPFVRRAAAEWIDPLPFEDKAAIGAPLLHDPVRTVRLAAAASLAGAPAALLGPEAAASLARAIEEDRDSLAFNADRAESSLNLGNLERRFGRNSEAEQAYRRAVHLDPTFVPAYVNLADLLGALGRDDAGETALLEGLRRQPESADLEHALGLARVRHKDVRGALHHLKRAVALRPESARYAYVYGVALHDSGDAVRAMAVLEDAAARHPADAAILQALAAYSRERGDDGAAARWEERLKGAGSR